MVGISVASESLLAGTASSTSKSTRKTTEPEGITPQVLLNGVNPLDWNAAVGRERGSGPAAPGWPALRVLGPSGLAESLYVFPDNTRAPRLVAAWPRQEIAAHWVRIFPNYRWLVVETAADSAARFYAPNGSLRWESSARDAPVALGRDLVLARRPSGVDSIPSRMSVLSLQGGRDLASWPALAGWTAASPLENFLAVNTIGVTDTTTGQRQDELRLLDLEGHVLWARMVAADPREFAVSNFGDVAIARELHAELLA
ncbi:MAG TPA: hypothetical protein VFD83_01975, partial [Candidatus Polarisedimenticolia bacterium]|nr:hypothetical protein [Candidatus Polarisedimenticolia bacterium]